MGFTALNTINAGGGRINTPLDPALSNPERAALIEDLELSDKFADLYGRAAKHDATGQGAAVASQREREAVKDAEAVVARLYADARDAGAAVDAAALKRAEAGVVAARARREQVEALAQPAFRARDAELDVAKRCMALLDTYVASGNEVVFVGAKPLGKTPAAAAEASAATALKKERRSEIERAPVTFETALATIIAEIELEAAKGIEVVLGVNGRPHIRWPLDRVHALAESSVLPTVVDAQALVTSLFPDAVIAKAREDLETIYRDVPLALDPTEKRKVLEGADRDVLDAERVEAATIWAAREAGHDVPWPLGISAHAVLGIF